MKIHKLIFVFFAFNLMIPTYSMFMRVRERLQPSARSVSSNVSPVGKTKPISKKSASSTRLRMTSPDKKNTIDAMREQVARFLKAQYARLSSLWKTESIPAEQKGLAVPIIPISQPQSEVIAQMPIASVEVTTQKSAAISAAQAEFDAIIAKLNGENPWNYPRKYMSNFAIAVNSPLAEEMRNFFEKNNVDEIENLFSMCIEERTNIADPKYTLSGILRDLCKKNKKFIVKTFPLIEKNYQRMDSDLLVTILLGLPSEFLPQAEKIIEFFFKNVSYFYLIAAYKPDDIARLLPEDSTKLVDLIKIICDSIANFFYQDRFARKEEQDKTISFIAKMLAIKIMNIKPDYFPAFIGNLLQSTVGRSLLAKLKLESTVIDYIKTEVIASSSNIDQLLQTVQGIQLLLYFVASSNDASLKGFVIDYIKKIPISMRILLQTKDGQNLILKLMNFDASLRVALNDYLKTEKDLNFIELSDYLARILDGPDFVKAIFGFDSSYVQVPSYRHLVKYYQYFSESYITSAKHIEVFDRMIQDDMRLTWNQMIQNAMHNEKRLVEGGRDVYYHGTRWGNNFFSELYMMLYSYKSGKEPKNFRFLHFDDPVLGKISQEFFESEEATSQQLVSKGTMASYRTKLSEALGIGRNTLFLAKYLFGNMSAPGCSPIALMLDNFNWGEDLLTAKEIFSMFGYLGVYQKHEQELLSLQEKHKNLSPYGELIQIAIPKENLNKCVYHAKLGYHAQKEKFKLPDGSTTDDINVISYYVNKNPEDGLEFILNMTRSTFGGHNPESGIEMFSYNLVEPEKMREFKEKDENPLLDKIRESLKQKDMQEHSAAIERD